MASSSASVFHFLFFLHLLLVFSSGYGHRIYENCPSSFQCGELGTFHFPFTKPELQHCGFITVHGCDDHPSSNKSIELDKNNGTKLWLLTGVNNKNTITVLDEDLGKLLKSKSYCQLFDTNLSSSLPPNSALVSFQILNNNTWIKCGHVHNVSRPTGFSKYVCSDYDVYWKGSSRLKHNNNNIQKPTGSFPNCSVLELPSTDMSHRTHDPLSFLTSQIVIQVRLSHECNNCYYHLRGQCLLDANNEFYCKSGDTSKGYVLGFGLGIGVSIAVMVGILVLIIYWFRRTSLWKNTSKAHQDFEAFLKNHGSLATKRYSYSEIKNMTNCFKEKLGQGGYGSVFKGKLHDKCPVAVKVLKETKGNGEEFMNEVASISKTSHVNIVTLLGFCFEGSKRALVYEFMANGSLEKFNFENEADLVEGNLQLSCEILHRIVVGVARGLEYLHRGCNTRIFHFDIKPHNILLEENFCPKISDFGLAKICPRNESVVSMLGARGTIGYIAPEVIYRNFGVVSHESDVYSFGMMVLEMVGGRRNVNVNVDDTSEIYFPHWIYKRLELDEDLALRSTRNEGDKERIRQMVITSLWCIQTNPAKRPMMSKVVEMLEGRLETLQVPPKPYLSSPSRSPCPSSSSTL
ncbi:hypothetical protein K1719_029662 [Acacia pycnantha]|nr:hypothetical protein K1719_029662 [Acacia pycnantha]